MDNFLEEATLEAEAAIRESHLKNGTLAIIEADESPETMARYEYERDLETLKNLGRKSRNLSDDIQKALWNIYKKEYYKFFSECETLKEWADTYLGELWGDNKSWLEDMVRNVEETLDWIDKNPDKVDITPEEVLEIPGIPSRLKRMNQVMKPNAVRYETTEDDEVVEIPITDEQRIELVNAAVIAKNREEVGRKASEIKGGAPITLPYQEVYDATDDTYTVVFADLNKTQHKMLMRCVEQYKKEIFS